MSPSPHSELLLKALEDHLPGAITELIGGDGSIESRTQRAHSVASFGGTVRDRLAEYVKRAVENSAATAVGAADDESEMLAKVEVDSTITMTLYEDENFTMSPQTARKLAKQLLAAAHNQEKASAVVEAD